MVFKEGLKLKTSRTLKSPFGRAETGYEIKMSSKTLSCGLFVRFSFKQHKDCSPDFSSMKPLHMEGNKETRRKKRAKCYPIFIFFSSGWICQAVEQNKTLNRWWPGKLGCNCSLTNLGSRTCHEMTGVWFLCLLFILI